MAFRLTAVDRNTILTDRSVGNTICAGSNNLQTGCIDVARVVLATAPAISVGSLRHSGARRCSARQPVSIAREVYVYPNH